MFSKGTPIIFNIHGTVLFHSTAHATRGKLFWKKEFVYHVIDVQLNESEVKNANKRFENFPDEDSVLHPLPCTMELYVKDFSEFPDGAAVSVEIRYVPIVSSGFSFLKRMFWKITKVVKV